MSSYRVEILLQRLTKSAKKSKLWCKVVLKIDVDPEHIASVFTNWLKDNEVKVLEWPSQSCDLSLIENVWTEL